MLKNLTCNLSFVRGKKTFTIYLITITIYKHPKLDDHIPPRTQKDLNKKIMFMSYLHFFSPWIKPNKVAITSTTCLLLFTNYTWSLQPTSWIEHKNIVTFWHKKNNKALKNEKENNVLLVSTNKNNNIENLKQWTFIFALKEEKIYFIY